MLSRPQTDTTIDIKKQAAKDIAKRAVPGCFIYLLCWAILILPTGFYAQKPVLVLNFTVLITLLAVFRYISISNFEKIYAYSTLLWTGSIYFNVLISGLAWGVLSAVSITWQSFSELTLLLIVALAGLTAAGAASLASDLKLSIGLILSYLLPPIVAISFFNTTFNLPLFLIFITFMTGLVGVVLTLNKEYWNALKNSVLITDYAAELENLNTLDSLTGLKNRRFFDEELSREIKRAERNSTVISLLMIDIDYFKTINDTYGHLAGDKCLQTAAETFSTIIKRDTDTISRYGGEEFAVILPGLSQEQAVQLAEKIRKAFETVEIKWNSLVIKFTLSIGVATIRPQKNYKYEQLIKLSDDALYKAKEEGRNRVASSPVNSLIIR